MDSGHTALLKAAMAAWPAQESSFQFGWYRRYSQDITKRCNAVWPIYASEQYELGEQISGCEAWYARRQRPCIFQISAASLPADIDAALAQRGYSAIDPSIVMTADIPQGSRQDDEQGLAVETRPTALVMNAIMPPDQSSRVRTARAALFNSIRKPRVFVIAHARDEIFGGAMGVADASYLGIFNMYVAPRFRRQGHGQRIVQRLMAWASGFGAREAYLQVECSNHNARQLYTKCGFREAFGYHYRIASS